LEFSSAFCDRRFEDFARQLDLYNPLPPSQAGGKTLVLIDATGSMRDVLESAKNTVELMFTRAHAILSEKGLADVGCEMKFAVYRNYGSGTSSRKGLLVASDWESNGVHLRDFMRLTKPHGGEYHEAIEVGLQYANQLSDDGQELAQVVLIGDMPANTREDVAIKRARALESKGYHYHGTPWEAPTYWEDELIKLREKEIPVHAFYINEYAKENFEEIARRSGAKYGFLNIGSEQGAEMLTGVVTSRILDNIGGVELVAAYEEKFGFVPP